MSNWTTIMGTVEMDNILTLFQGKNCYDVEREVKEYLGAVAYYGDDDSKTTLPLGSEGSLTYSTSIIRTDKSNEATSFRVMLTLYGRLRDFDSENVEKELLPWFNKLIKDLPVDRYMLAYAVNDNPPQTLLNI